LPRSNGVLAVVALLAGCAQAPAEKPQTTEPAPPATLGALPATFISQAGCPGCQQATVTLRADGSFLLRDQLGASEFYDFGRWRYADGSLELAGDRDARRYRVSDLRRNPSVQALRGPFRMVGLYDGARFKECLTGLAWSFAPTRAAETLQQEFRKQPGAPVLVSLDAQLEGSPEALRVFRTPTVLNSRTCPS
jgi:hypothetical protein